LIPSESKAIKGKSLLEERRLSWQEGSSKAEKPAPDKN
jgi:hypothetical protein